MSGYARLHRSLLGHPAFRNDAEAMAFAWMILRASWRPTRVRYKGRAVSLNRGQLATSIRDMAEAMDRDKAWIERLFKRLKSETMIETVTEAGVSVVTICNYAEYQADCDIAEAVRETVRETDARQTQDTEQRREEGKKEVDANASTARARDPFPRPDFADPQSWRDFLVNRKRKRLPNTASAHKSMMDDISRLADDEWPPGRLIEHAAAKGWGGIYDPREGRNNGIAVVSGRRPTDRGDSRGSRPDPSVDLRRQAMAELAAQGPAAYQEDRRGDWI